MNWDLELEHIMKCPVDNGQICSVVSIQIIFFKVFLVIVHFFSIDISLLGFFPFWSIPLICFSLIFLLLAVAGLIGYSLGCRRPTLEELYANEFEQLSPDDEYLLGTGEGLVNLNETKISIPISSNGYFDQNHQDFRYESLQPIERTRIGQSHEDMV